MTSEVVMRPLRFTADVGAMRAFLETLGLQARIESEHGGWVDMLAGRGMVALHDAATSATGGQPGQTRLTFEAADVDELERRLENAGYADVAIWDEAYGRVIRVAGPGGESVHIDERSQDLYGYRVHAARPDERWSVTPYLRDRDRTAWEQLLTALGAEPDVRFGSAADDEPLLDFSTTEDLGDVLRRLTTAGHQVTRVGSTLEIVDPDGCPVVVHG